MTVLIDLAYILFLIPASLLLIPWLARRGMLDFSFIRGWFGYCPDSGLRDPVMYHVVSFGEFRNVSFLIHKSPGPALVVTPDPGLLSHLQSGWEGKNRKVMLAPLDFSWAVKRFLDRTEPVKIIISEVDIWPNLLIHAWKRKIPVCWINARLSLANRRLFRLFPLFRLLLSRIRTFPKDRDNMSFLRSLKVPAEEWVNFKLLFAAEKENRDLSRKEECLIVGSSHEEDERIVFSALEKIRSLGIRTVFVPRNIERADAVISLGREYGYKGALEKEKDRNADFTVVDRMGVLCSYYRDARYALVGGSFTDLGGHNIIEPAYYGCRVFFGPFIRNFGEEAEVLIRMGIGNRISNGRELMDTLASSGETPDRKAFSDMISLNRKRFDRLAASIFPGEGQ